MKINHLSFGGHHRLPKQASAFCFGHGHSTRHKSFDYALHKGINNFSKPSAQMEAQSTHLKVNPLQICNESNEEVGVVQLLSQLGYSLSLGLLVTCATQHLFQRRQILRNLLRNLNNRSTQWVSRPWNES